MIRLPGNPRDSIRVCRALEFPIRPNLTADVVRVRYFEQPPDREGVTAGALPQVSCLLPGKGLRTPTPTSNAKSPATDTGRCKSG